MDGINLSQKCSAGLSKINNIGLDELKNICKFILQSVISGQSNIVIDQKNEEVLGAISTIIFEASCVNSTVEQFKNALIENNVDSASLELLVTLFEQHRDTFIQKLSTIGISFPTIVDVDWRLDYVVRSKEGGKENSPLFLITLHIFDCNLIHYVDMLATEGELQDLLSKVKDAVKQVDRELNTKS